MQIQSLLAITVLGTRCVLTLASWEKIAGYAPGSKVTAHNAIDLDQKALQNALAKAPVDYTLAKAIYQQGGNSKSYAEFTVPPLVSALSKGNAVVGVTSGIQGTVYSNYAVGVTTIRVAYLTSEVQDTYTSCKKGALATVPLEVMVASATQPYQFLTGCFTTTEDLRITTSSGDVTIKPSSSPVNKAGRTLQGFSTKAEGTMYKKGPNGGCSGASDRSTDGCPYHDFSMYYGYYGDFDYANKFVLAAMDGTPTTFTKAAGEMDFTGTPDALRVQCIQKGTAYMNAYMYAIREFEDAIDDCKAGCTNGINGTGANCNDLSTAAVHAWDEGVAFYTGSREGVSAGGNGNGVMSYRLAEKRCVNFKTCGENHDALSGPSYVNIEIFRLLQIGATDVLYGRCEAVRPVVRNIVALMAIPLIQGTLRYAYKVGRLSGGDKEKGEGAVFAAAIVPRVASCSPIDADTIMNNMKVGASSTDFTAVKTAFENNYGCMDITCEKLGGLWYVEQNTYYDGASPCGVSSPNQGTADLASPQASLLLPCAIMLLVWATGPQT